MLVPVRHDAGVSTALLVSARQILRGPVTDRLVDGAVLAVDGTITAVGPRAEVAAAAPPGTEHHDHPDATLLPGLVDGHVHLALEPGRDPFRPAREDDDATLEAAMAHAAGTLLRAGVTTVRDLGDRGYLALRVRDAIAAGTVPGPRVLAAGAPLTPPDGHCHVLGGVVDGPVAIAERIAAHAAAGVDLIKVMASGGQTTTGGAAMWESQFDRAELALVVDEAARHGLSVAAHAHGAQAIEDAVAAGVATVEHCTWMSGPGTSDQRPEVVAEMARRGTVACTGSSADWRRLGALIGDEQRAFDLMSRVRGLAEAGVRVVPGTDAGLTPFDGLPAALGRHRDFGFSAAEILDMATSGAADALGLGAVTGRLAPGLAADLLVVDGDPVEDLDRLADVRMVVAVGRVAS